MEKMSEGRGQSESAPIPERKTYNILVLGETGVGKSTFINAFANYITFETLEDALKSDQITSLVPTRFTILDDDFHPKHIEFGSDANESWKPGASATQSARTYRFTIGNSTVRLIDTPGMGDTRGIKKDEENFENILNVIGELDEIHAVCLMLKPNDSRITVLFEYCVKQLFSYLQRSFCQNIVFLFTNSRGTLYRPGDTITPLKKMLKEIESRPPNVTVPFSNKNVFCVDNEAFRFLIASKEGIAFDDDETRRYLTSWNKSADACLSLLKYVEKIQPHKVQETVSINESRRLISMLYQPLTEITENIAKNLRLIGEHRTTLKDSEDAVSKLKDKLYIPVANMRVTSDSPRNVCTHEACTRIIEVEDSKTTDYRVCHNYCYLLTPPKQLVGDPALRGCTVMSRGICKVCGHSYSIHMHLAHVAEVTVEKIIDENVDRNLQGAQDEAGKVKDVVAKLKSRKTKYVQELDFVQKAMAKFSHFLSHNVIAGYVDKYEDYVAFLIQRESKLGEDGDKRLLRRLRKSRKAYEEEKEKLEDELEEIRRTKADVVSAVSPGEIVDVVQELYALELTGANIREIFDKQRSVRQRQILTNNEREFAPPAGASTKFTRHFGQN